MLLRKGAPRRVVEGLKRGGFFEGSPVVTVARGGNMVILVTGDGSVFHLHRKNKVFTIFRKTRKSAAPGP